MLYKELYFQGSTIRFINANIVAKDVYDFFGEYYIAHGLDINTIYGSDITNVIKDITFETLTFPQVNKLLYLFKENGKAVEIFRNWLTNFAYVYIKDFIANSIQKKKLNELIEAVHKLQTENAELKEKISKYASTAHTQKYSLDLLSKSIGLDVNINTGVVTSEIEKLSNSLDEIKAILCEQVGLECEPIKPPIKPVETLETRKAKLEEAFKELQTVYGILSNKVINLYVLKYFGYHLALRAKNRRLSIIDYTSKDKHLTDVYLHSVKELIKVKDKV